MGFEANTGLGVKNHYGARASGQTVGRTKTEGALNEVTLNITPDTLTGDIHAAIVIPAGSTVVSAYVDVTEAFALGGTTPTILVGTDTSEVTNGIVISEALAEGTLTTDITGTLAGTWGAKLAADTTIGIELGGTTPTVGADGSCTVVVTYLKVVG